LDKQQGTGNKEKTEREREREREELANTRIYRPYFGDLKELIKNKKKRRKESAYMNLFQPHKHAEANASIILWYCCSKED
jgi:hypothetical protein